MKKPCYKKQYDFRSCVCQCCKDSFSCGEQDKGKICFLPLYLRNHRIITFLQILNAQPNITAKKLKEEMIKVLGGRVNVFNYLNLLKKEGLIEMSIKGRKRVYRLT